MPKKTKKQKLSAQARRKRHDTTPVEHRHTTDTPAPSQASTFTFRASSHAPSTNTSQILTKDEYTGIRQDLIKTVALAVIGIAVEVGIAVVVG